MNRCHCAPLLIAAVNFCPPEPRPTHRIATAAGKKIAISIPRPVNNAPETFGKDGRISRTRVPCWRAGATTPRASYRRDLDLGASACQGD